MDEFHHHPVPQWGRQGKSRMTRVAQTRATSHPLTTRCPMLSNKPTLAAPAHKVAVSGAHDIGHKRGRERYDRRGDAAGTFAGSVLVAFGLVKLLPAPSRHSTGGFVDHEPLSPAVILERLLESLVQDSRLSHCRANGG